MILATLRPVNAKKSLNANRCILLFAQNILFVLKSVIYSVSYKKCLLFVNPQKTL